MASSRERSIAGDTKRKEGHDKRLVDVTSRYFDPAVALSSSNVPLPFPDAVPFNNLAEYTTYVSGHHHSARVRDRGVPGANTDTSVRKHVSIDRESLAGPSGRQPSSSGHVPQKGVKADDTREKTDPESENRQMSLAEIRRAKLNRNVLTRMGKMEKGPLSLLLRCVRERLLVKVWTRGAVELRGMCRGYIVAFDKHFNLAMMDVDELYRCPVSRDIEIKRQKKMEKRKLRSLRQKTSTLTLASQNTPAAEEQDHGRSHSNEGSIQQKNSSSQVVDTVTGKSTIATPGAVTEVKGDKSCDQNADLFAFISSLKYSKPSSQNEQIAKDVSTSSGEQAEANSSHTLGKIETLDRHGAKVSSTSTVRNLEHTDSTGETSVLVGGSRETRMPPVKQPVQHTMLERHVNQLFIRGDNVVSVTILE